MTRDTGLRDFESLFDSQSRSLEVFSQICKLNLLIYLSKF